MYKALGGHNLQNNRIAYVHKKFLIGHWVRHTIRIAKYIPESYWTLGLP